MLALFFLQTTSEATGARVYQYNKEAAKTLLY
jgi:hypothetical protein